MATQNTARAADLPACDAKVNHGSRVSRILASAASAQALESELSLGLDHARTLRVSRQLKRRK